MPAVAAVEESYADEITLVRVSDRQRDIWGEFGVTSQPAYAFIDDDGAVELHRGSLSESELASRVDDLIAR